MLFLFLMTGSLVIPLKALIASALSLGASIGVLVWGFEQGNFAPVMGFDPADVHGVDVLVLLLTFAFGFGLAMDYEMFILSRIKEQVDAGVPDREAIARGLQRSGRIITSAALIIIVVFAGFATGDLMVIKQLGTALAVAVLLDATLVRCLLVPGPDDLAAAHHVVGAEVDEAAARAVRAQRLSRARAMSEGSARLARWSE